MLQKNWKHYLPGLFCFGAAWLVLLIPSIAVFLVLTVLVTFGVLYLFVVYQIHKGLVSDFEAQYGDPSAPKFKEVSVYIMRRGRDFYDSH